MPDSQPLSDLVDEDILFYLAENIVLRILVKR